MQFVQSLQPHEVCELIVAHFRAHLVNEPRLHQALHNIIRAVSKQLDVSGNLVPINQISQLLGDVPVLGDLITGVDKLGIFVTQFKLTGPIDKPVTEVNPVSSFAPGVIRDLFSPNWLGNEKKRLLGPTSQE